MTGPHPTEFQYQHLPEHLQKLCQRFAELAGRIASTIPANGDSDAALEHLLQARDLALRAFRHDETSHTQPELDFGEGAGPAFEADEHRLLDPG